MIASVLIYAVIALRLANPVTPWLVLAACIAGWLAVYLFVTSERD